MCIDINLPQPSISELKHYLDNKEGWHPINNVAYNTYWHVGMRNSEYYKIPGYELLDDDGIWKSQLDQIAYWEGRPMLDVYEEMLGVNVRKTLMEVSIEMKPHQQ